MSNTLTRFHQLGYYDSASGDFIMNSNVEPSLTLLNSATLTVGGDPEGEEFPICVQYSDPVASDSYDWEIMIAAYSYSGGLYRLTYVRTVCSSNAGAPVVFNYDASNHDNLRIYGVRTHEEDATLEAYTDAVDTRVTTVGGRVTTLEGHSKVLHTDVLSDATDYSTTGTSMVQMSGIFTKTPESGSSNLRGYIRLDSRLAKTSGSNDDWRARFQTYYRDSGGTWTDIGASVFVGHINFAGSSTGTLYQDAWIPLELTQSKLNATGDWEFCVYGENDYSNMSLNVYQAQVYMVEAEN